MDKWNLKSQVAIEFMILVGVMVFVFVMILGIVANEGSEVRKEKEVLLGEDIISKAQKEITIASMVSDGYSRDFVLPNKIGNKDYSISINNNKLVISTQSQDFWRKIPDIVGIIKKGNNTISKRDGILYLNQ